MTEIKHISDLKGKKLSILGDSISTYKGVSNNKEANITLEDHPYFYCQPMPESATYWAIIKDKFSLELCVNNSWSGGNLTGEGNSTSGVERVKHLANNNCDKPDIIIFFMGINDLGRNVPIEIFTKDYKKTLDTIKKLYKDAKVCCVNLPDRDIFLKDRAEKFNVEIEKAVEESGENFFIADLYNSRLNNDFYYMNTLDGLHPDKDGMKIIAEIIENSIRNYLK